MEGYTSHFYHLQNVFSALWIALDQHYDVGPLGNEVAKTHVGRESTTNHTTEDSRRGGTRRSQAAIKKHLQPIIPISYTLSLYLYIKMASVRHNFHADCERAINQQINNELASSYFYLSLAYHFDRDDVALKNFHQYSCKLSAAKKANAERLMKLMNERGGRVRLVDVPTPANNFGEPIEIMQVLLQHEKQVRKLASVEPTTSQSWA